MAGYLLIESRDPFESNDVGYYYELAGGLVEAGNQVTLFLVQNAVLAARPSAQAPQLRRWRAPASRYSPTTSRLRSAALPNSSTASRSRRSRSSSTILKPGTRLSGTRRRTCRKRPSPSH